MAGNNIDTGRSVTSKISAILHTFTQGSEHGLTEIASLAGLPMSTAHRLIGELVDHRLLQRTPDGTTGSGFQCGSSAPSTPSTPNIAERGPYLLEDLATVTECVARLGVLQELRVAYISKQPGPKPASQFSAAATLPVHPTALGRALLAFAPASLTEAVIRNGLRQYTRHTITSPERFRRAVTIARLTRVAVTRRELDAHLCGVAVPVFGVGGNIIAAVEFDVPDLSRGLQRVIAPLAIAARSLSRELAGEARPEQLRAAAG